MVHFRGSKSAGERHLASRIALILGVILLLVFTGLIGTVIGLTGNGMRTAIGDEFSAMAKGTGLQVQNVLTSAQNSANAVAQYIQKELKSGSGAGKQDREYTSAIYGKPISESSYEAEKYITQTVRESVRSSPEVVGMGVLFEPYAFDQGLSEYAFYVSDQAIDQPLEPYLPYAEFSAQEYYAAPLKSKTTHITEPYQDAGYTMVTCCYPIIAEGRVYGVVTADINVSDFSKAVYENDKYPSKYTTILNGSGIVIYDTESLDNVGGRLSDFIVDSKALQIITDGMNGTEAFRVDIVREDGRTEASYYYPIISGQTKWWALTALEKSDLNKSVTRITIVLAVTAAAALAVTLLLLCMIVRKMLRPIDTVVEAAEKIAAGNLDIHLQAQSNDEIGRLVAAFSVTIDTLKGIIGDIGYILSALAKGNFHIESQRAQNYIGDYTPILNSIHFIRDNLNETMTQINQSADQVAGGANQVSGASQALSQGATEQASSVEELAATITEISQQVSSTAQNAVQARSQTEEAGREVAICSQQMQEMITAMDEISHRSEEIGKIIKTIEDIAFQTNILALNAAVEAARAGAAGKGFAVVADEVRNLASKSAEASKNTSSLIEGSIRAVELGTRTAGQTALSLSKVVEGTQAVSSTVGKIADAAKEQAGSISQVTQGIDQISSVVQTNSATAEESAAASEELSGQAQMLKDLVSRFQLMEDRGSGAAGFSPAPGKLGDAGSSVFYEGAVRP